MQESVAYLQQGGGISCLRLSLPLLRFSAAFSFYTAVQMFLPPVSAEFSGFFF